MRADRRELAAVFAGGLLDMLDAGRAALAGGYAAASVAAGGLAIALATNLVRRARVRA